jgi:hypothetical protein
LQKIEGKGVLSKAPYVGDVKAGVTVMGGEGFSRPSSPLCSATQTIIDGDDTITIEHCNNGTWQKKRNGVVFYTHQIRGSSPSVGKSSYSSPKTILSSFNPKK